MIGSLELRFDMIIVMGIFLVFSHVLSCLFHYQDFSRKLLDFSAAPVPVRGRFLVGESLAMRFFQQVHCVSRTRARNDVFLLLTRTISGKFRGWSLIFWGKSQVVNYLHVNIIVQISVVESTAPVELNPIDLSKMSRFNLFGWGYEHTWDSDHIPYYSARTIVVSHLIFWWLWGRVFGLQDVSQSVNG